MPYLEIKLGPDTLLVPFVGRIDYVIGRLPKADIQLRDMKVSRLHTQLFIDSRGRAFVRDLGSSGGTVMNNTRLRSGAIAPLVMGTKIRIGDARITFYDQEPPVNAAMPPSKSDPRGLVRTNHRERLFHAEATVLAADKVSAETENGPAEAPPEVDPMVFADSAVPPSAAQPAVGAAPPAKPAAAPAKPGTAPGKAASGPQKPPPKRRDTGIVEAPWEAAESNRHQPAKGEKRVTIPPPTRGGAKPPAAKSPPPMPTAEIDETGKFHEPMPAPGAPTQYVPPPRPGSPVPPARPGTADFRNAKPAPTPSVRAPQSPLNEPEEMSLDDAVVAFVPPPPPPPRPADLQEDDAPASGMPTVRLDRAALLARRAAEEAAAKKEEEESPRIPTATVRPDARPAPAAPADDDAPAPRIGLAPGEKPPTAPLDDLIEDVQQEASAEVAQKAAQGEEEESLTDEQIAVYLGGSASGRYDAVDFGEDGAKKDEDDGEVAINSKFAAPPAEDVDFEEPPPTPAAPATAEPPAEVSHVNTSMLGNTTAIREEAVEDSAEEPVPEYKAADDHQTPPPPSRTGAVADQGFKKPHKTRKLMKRRTEKVTDRTRTPPPESKPTEMVAPDLVQGEVPVTGGAKTIFIPKPADAKLARTGAAEPAGDDDETGRAPVQGKKVQDMGFGPGGDTVALPPDMMKQLRAELAGKKPPADKPAPATIGESPTVKHPPTEVEDEEFIVDDNYAFFTPPPPTRAAKAKAAKAEQSDVIDANDFNAETDNLPPEKRAKPGSDPDTIVD
ncbi:MAG: FHA domain-containing protein [Planctomycetes bacterium]|nr:FHA domain-containing protein [Planctomycetota bacterium]MCL4731246.1 FHA domain-containing protein [Planctomycetota bacterium]